jgi:hypothetical protein
MLTTARIAGALAVLALASSQYVHAQSATANDSTRRDLARRVLVITRAAETTITQMESLIPAQAAATPNVPPIFWDRFMERTRASIDTLVTVLIPAYADHFTTEELRGMLAFYESPLGRRMVELQPAVMQTSYQIAEQWGERLAQEVAAELLASGQLGGTDDKEVLADTAAYAPIRMGETVNGSFTQSTKRLSDGTPFRGYTFDGTAGSTVEIEMRSAAFDAFLSIGRAGADTMLIHDDDSAGDTDARVIFTLPTSGRYVIIATAIDSASEGAYTLRVGTGRPLIAAEDVLMQAVPSDRRITAGQTVTSQLTSESQLLTGLEPFEVWYLEGRAGERVTITMRSPDFDSFLHIGKTGTGGKQELWENDDDSGGDLDSQLTVTLPSNGIYAVIAQSLESNGRGSYTLEVRAASSP